uniref:MARVEL domain-containing protein n=1 Tax=Steinernema glaseri TaxID=37863 RepID=A0A1I7XYR1_9BILA
MFLQQIIYSFVASIVYLVLGGVEVWYAVGFGHMTSALKEVLDKYSGPGHQVQFVDSGWAVAAALLLLCALLNIADGVVVCFRRGRYHVMLKYYR